MMDPMCGFGMGDMGSGGSGGLMLPPGMEETACFAFDDTEEKLCQAIATNLC